MGGGQQGDRLGGEAEAGERLVDELHGGPVGAVGVLSPLEHAGVAALQAEGEHVEGDVGPGLVYHAYHAEGHAHLAQAQAVGEGLLRQRAPQGGGEAADGAHVRGDARQPLGRELQPVVEGVRLVHQGEVLCVGLQQPWCPLLDGVGHGLEYLSGAAVGQQGQLFAGRPRLPEGVCEVCHGCTRYVMLMDGAGGGGGVTPCRGSRSARGVSGHAPPCGGGLPPRCIRCVPRRRSLPARWLC